MSAAEPSVANSYLVEHVNLLRYSLRHYKKQDLLEFMPVSLAVSSDLSSELSDVEVAKAVYEAPFAIVSHDTSSNPIFNYGNKTALRLFEMTWEEFTSLPSRQSAELPNQAERDRLLARVSSQGWIDDYSGVRISKNSKRFWIEQAAVWNLIDSQNSYCGQAACWNTWRDA